MCQIFAMEESSSILSPPTSGPVFPCKLPCTVEPPLTATSLQRPLFFVPTDSPYITSCLNLERGNGPRQDRLVSLWPQMTAAGRKPTGDADPRQVCGEIWYPSAGLKGLNDIACDRKFQFTRGYICENY